MYVCITTAKAFSKDVFINQKRKLGGSKTIKYHPSLHSLCHDTSAANKHKVKEPSDE